MRETFLDNCLRLARNDPSLTGLEARFQKDSAAPPSWRLDSTDLILIGEALKGNTHLKELNVVTDVCKCFDDDNDLVRFPPPNSMEMRGAALFGNGVFLSQLHTLRLQHVCCHLQTALMCGAAICPTLQQFELRETTIADIRRVIHLLLQPYGSMPPFYRQMQVSELNIEHCRLTHLSLRSCDMDDTQMLTISLALADNVYLVSLDLESNNVTNIGVMYFCQHWKDDSPIQELDLTYNQLTATGALLLVEESKRHFAMRKLLLTGNHQIGHDGLRRIAEELPFIHLKILELHNINPLPVSAKPTVESKAAARAVADGLRRNRSLIELHVGGNHFGIEGAMGIMEVTKTHPTVELLAFVCDESIGLKGLCQIGKMLPQTKLNALQLDGIYFPWPTPPTKLSRQAGEALLEGVRNTPGLVRFTYHRMDSTWMMPIQYLIDLNLTCRVLLGDDILVPSVWPRILEKFRRMGKMGHVYFALREQPWLVSPTVKV